MYCLRCSYHINPDMDHVQGSAECRCPCHLRNKHTNKQHQNMQGYLMDELEFQLRLDEDGDWVVAKPADLQETWENQIGEFDPTTTARLLTFKVRLPRPVTTQITVNVPENHQGGLVVEVKDGAA